MRKLGEKLWRWEDTKNWGGIQRVHVAAYEHGLVVNPPVGMGSFEVVKSDYPVARAKLCKASIESVRESIDGRLDAANVRSVLE